ncbi:hypothetical protein REIS_0678 [Rickettsia endosymbiont of Ixodes scapularis]|nr:hypothetical protein REIS_0678 [Rickettsia endosymbiont of Ixodes scapularis]
MKNFIKYLFFTGLRSILVVMIIVAYMVLAQTIPNDGQCLHLSSNYYRFTDTNFNI